MTSTRIIGLWAVAALLCGHAAAQQAGSDCSTSPPTHVQLAPGDPNTAKHLDVARAIAAGAAIELNICGAQLIIKGAEGDQFRITADSDTAAPHQLGDYLEALDITPSAVHVRLNLPKQPPATVTIVIPAKTPKLELNLVHGDLRFDTDRIAGDREINVVAGHVILFANPDTYHTLESSIVMGSYHDRRPPNLQSAHGLVSKSLSGTGVGAVKVNVVRGSRSQSMGLITSGRRSLSPPRHPPTRRALIN